MPLLHYYNNAPTLTLTRPLYMAVTDAPVVTQADTIKHDLQNSSTTSPATLNLLRALLGLDLAETKHSDRIVNTIARAPKVPPEIPARSSARPPVRKPLASRIKVNQDFQDHNATSTITQPLPLDRRRALATDTFNITLKRLTFKAKEIQKNRQVQIAATPRASPKDALHAKSPNHRVVGTADGKLKTATAGAAPVPKDVVALRTTADCAIASLWYLDGSAHTTEGDPIHSDDLLVRGSQILLDKLIILGLTLQAEQQVWHIWKQLRSRLGLSTSPVRGNASSSTAMIFDTMPVDIKLLNAVSTFQLQVLKVGALVGAGFIDEGLLNMLSASSSSSPVVVCLKAVESGVMTEDQAGLHLHMIATILSRNCSVIRVEKHSSLNLLQKLQLTTAMLNIRCHSWKMLGHKADLEKELWTPLNRGLQEYSQKCDASYSQDLDLIMVSITALQKLLASFGQVTLLPMSTTDLLVDIAQRCQSTQHALAFLNEEISTAGIRGNLAGVINRCRAATIVLAGTESDSNARQASCEAALSSLTSSLKGTASELQNLLLHSAKLRKAVTVAILHVEKSIQEAKAHENDISLQMCSIRLLYSINRFVRRYVGQLNAPSTVADSGEKQAEKQSAVHNSARHTVDSVLSVMKCQRIRSIPLREETEAALKDCLQSTILLDESTPRAYDQAPREKMPPSPHLRVSNIYWAWYLHDKSMKLETEQLCRLLEQSIASLDPCMAEERIIAFEVVKLERLAACYQSLGQHRKAEVALRRAVKAAIDQGALNEAVEIVLTKPSRLAWKDHRLSAYILGACLRELARASAKNEDGTQLTQVPCFDDETLPHIHRAQLLEIQLFAVAELTFTAFTGIYCTSLAKQILNLCQQQQYHIYRIRFIRDLLNLATRHAQFPIQDILDDELLQTACTFQQADCTSSCYLTSYGPLLCLSILLQWAFLTTRPSPECLRGLIGSTALLLSQCRTTAELDAAVDDPDSLVRQLSAAADYAGMLDLVDVRLRALQAMHHILQKQAKPDLARLMASLTDMGKTSARLGDTSLAGRCFAEGEKLLNNSVEHSENRLDWCLAYSRYLIKLEAYGKAAQMINTAASIYSELAKDLATQPGDCHRLKQDSVLSHAALAASELAFHQNDLQSAIIYARKCVKLTSGLWAALEKLFDGVKDQLEASRVDFTNATMEESVDTTFSLDQSSLQCVIKGASFWAHVHIHFCALLHISSLSAYCGLYADAVYYTILASKMSSLLTSEQRQFTCRVRLAVLHAKGGLTAEAKVLIKAMRNSSFDLLPQLEASCLSLDLATAAFFCNDLSTSDHFLGKAEASISKAATPVSSDTSAKLSTISTIEEQMNMLNITESKAIVGSKPCSSSKKPKTIPALRNGSRKATVSSQAPSAVLTTKLISPVVAQLQEAKCTLALRIKLAKGQLPEQVYISEHNISQVHPSASSEKELVDATVLLNQALTMLCSDAVHSLLAETTLAYPSKYSARRPSGRVSELSARTDSAKSKRVTVRSRQKQQSTGNSATDDGVPASLLRKAYELLSSAYTTGSNQSSSNTVHDIQKLFSRLSMLASAVGLTLSCSPMKVMNDSLKPKDTMLLRESFVLDSDLHSSDRSELRTWQAFPKDMGSGLERNDVKESEALTTAFDGIPETWSVVSISLNDAKSEILLSRATTGTAPLILRIPLARSAIEDIDENEFPFSEAKAELDDIITGANLTAHDARSQGEKAARKIWWAEREVLDRRLETLLLNIENIWLGGFRGIMCQQRNSDADLLSRFSNSLDAALDKHLPSRQKNSGVTNHRVRLHGHILDLFVALGDPDEKELDNAITDLLYFVVDILQFEGERNAYDEIDFDAILVEVLDALRSYHERCPADSTPRHTILILDKELHAFPWESMPCLLRKSVSRMPSLGMIGDRLACIRAQSADTDAYTISAASGGYILNPSSDLTSTEMTFASAFAQQLPTFKSIISRKPSELEFEALLRDNPLILYFGHGSGAQYIRGRRIKQLKKCAVTFLMGCSSGKMTECGVFESHGVPLNYMHAGSMAVVGTLWDVTDRDIDRFAMTAFEHWGLLEGVQEDEKARKKTEARKRKVGGRRVKEVTTTLRKGRGQVALDEAVNRARDACILRYLNGAAVVIYGLPVMLV